MFIYYTKSKVKFISNYKKKKRNFHDSYRLSAPCVLLEVRFNPSRYSCCDAANTATNSGSSSVSQLTRPRGKEKKIQTITNCQCYYIINTFRCDL